MEICCSVIGFVSVAAIVLVLKNFDGKTQPEFAFRITLNTLVQFITTVGTAAISSLALSAVGQLAWLSYKGHSLPLGQLDDHLNAAGLGSLKLLFRLRFSLKWPLQWLVAILTISGFLISPLTQQTIAYRNAGVPSSDGDALVFRATAVSRSVGVEFRPGDYAAQDLASIEAAILGSTYVGPGSKISTVEPSCSTGNCTWPNYQSLAICAELKNITDRRTQLTVSSFVASLLKNYYGVYPLGYPVYPAFIMNWGGGPSGLFNKSVTESTLLEQWIAFSDSMVTFSANFTFSTLQFYGLALFLCTKTYSTDVTAGLPHVDEVSTAVNVLTPLRYNANSWWNETLFLNDTCPPDILGDSLVLGGPADAAGETYEVDACTAAFLSNLIGQVMYGVILQDQNHDVLFEIGQISTAVGEALFGNFLSKGSYNKTTEFANMNAMVDSIANSLTNFIIGEGSSFYGSSGNVTGVAYRSETVVEVHWPWICAIGIYMTLATIFLISTIIRTHASGLETVKRSSLAIMFGLDPAARYYIEQAEPNDLSILKERARETRVTLAGTQFDQQMCLTLS